MIRPRFARIKSFIGDAVTEVIPKEVKNYVKNTILTKQVPQKVDWDSKVRKKVISSLEKDIKSILDYCGKHENFWKLNDL